ncbi:hypothetical protein ACGC1H_004067 [Rhizoctonia solani]|uniref:Uncharacterized protein n=1 Tax=Rhizoctonia solani TaxID=456999 RepID=A0A8H3BWJ1_9AGAM|nr:unnamed protein product [Rhizoctonia solani]
MRLGKEQSDVWKRKNELGSRGISTHSHIFDQSTSQAPGRLPQFLTRPPPDLVVSVDVMSLKPGNPPLVYDENLLAQAPEVTQGQRQEGYDADILNPSPPPTSRTPAPIQPYRDHLDVESGSSGHDKHLAAGGYDHVGQSANKPFWKTPKGMIILAVLAVAVIAAVVGGAVGGTVGKNKNNNPETTGSSPVDASGNNPISLPTTNSTLSPTTAARPPTETPEGGNGAGGAGSNQSSSTQLGGTSPTLASSVSRPSSTLATITSPSVDLPGQGNGV